MGHLATLMNAPRRWIHEFNDKKHAYDVVFKGDDYMWHGKHYAHFFLRDEFEKLVKSTGIDVLEMVGLEGLASPDPDAFNLLPKKYPKAYKNWIELHYKICTNPTIVDTSGHILIVGKKK